MHVTCRRETLSAEESSPHRWRRSTVTPEAHTATCTCVGTFPPWCVTTGGTPSVACFKHPNVSRMSFCVKHSAAILYCHVFRVLILTVMVIALVKCLLLRSVRPFTAFSAGTTVSVPGWSVCCRLLARGSGQASSTHSGTRAEPKGLSPGPRFLEKSQEPRVCSEFLKMIIA